MPSPKTQPARGMRDFLPADVRKREYVIGVIKQVYERYGFEPLETPAVENIETLTGKYGEEGSKLMFRISKRNLPEQGADSDANEPPETDLALRYDLTVPLARVVARFQNELPAFYKRYQIQPVWRAERNQKGRFREFYQCDVDVLGSGSMIVEAELCGAVSEVLSLLGFSNFVIRLNHRSVLNALLEVVGIPQSIQSRALVSLDKLEKIGRSGVALEFGGFGISSYSSDRLLTFFENLVQLRHAAQSLANGNIAPEVEAANRSIHGRLVEFVGDHEAGAKGISQLMDILNFSEANETSNRIRLDPSLARGLSYYTGPIMEIAVPDLSGSLGGGGRYDELIGNFLGRPIPACGFSLGLERILVVMEQRGMFPEKLVASSAEVLVTVWLRDSDRESQSESIRDSLQLATILRRSGIRVDLDMKPAQGGWYGYTRTKGIRFFIVSRPEDRSRGEVKLVDMRPEQPDDLPVQRDALVSILKEKLNKA